MAWSHSAFLQALGWATLNSLWQMALLWVVYVAANHLFSLSSQVKYKFSIAAVFAGFAWFVYSFVFYEQDGVNVLPAWGQSVKAPANILNICLVSASFSYLMLLVFPAYKLFKNWRFLQLIKKDGLSKANLEYRLFVQKLSSQLTIGRKVKVFLSDVVSSPLTVGYLKPIILLPVAAINQLSLSQVEAVLLHELSHIKRYDYIINLLTTIIHTILYFNPFVKMFMAEIEAERENCCDELVLQFGYDKVSYASALLTLEKSSARRQLLVLGVTGKKNLLTRIEKIVGMEQRKRYSVARLAPVLGALICILMFNSLLIIKDSQKANAITYGTSSVVSPLYFIENGSVRQTETLPAKNPVINFVPQNILAQKKAEPTPSIIVEVQNFVQPPVAVAKPVMKEGSNDFHNVALDEANSNLTTKEKEQVKETLEATRKVLTNLQWKEVETAMADALNNREKAAVKEEFLNELEKVNWSNIENNLKANYQKIDWQKLNTSLSSAMNNIQLDSIQNSYQQMLTSIEAAESQIKSHKKCTTNLLPDQSLTDLKKMKLEVKVNLESLKAMRNKPVIRL